MAARQALLTTADAPFGEELRKRRTAANISLIQLSRMTFYSKGFLSKVERGLQPASRELARMCDTALGRTASYLPSLAGRACTRRRWEKLSHARK